LGCWNNSKLYYYKQYRSKWSRCKNQKQFTNEKYPAYYNNGIDVQVANVGSTFKNNYTSNILTGNVSNNIIADPFDGIDVTFNPFDLPLNSVCINAGLNKPWMTGEFDISGNQRIFDTTVDIGAFEFVYTSPSVPVLVSPSNFNVGVSIEPTFTWNAVPNADSYTLQIATDASF